MQSCVCASLFSTVCESHHVWGLSCFLLFSLLQLACVSLHAYSAVNLCIWLLLMFAWFLLQNYFRWAARNIAVNIFTYTCFTHFSCCLPRSEAAASQDAHKLSFNKDLEIVLQSCSDTIPPAGQESPRCSISLLMYVFRPAQLFI